MPQRGSAQGHCVEGRGTSCAARHTDCDCIINGFYWMRDRVPMSCWEGRGPCAAVCARRTPWCCPGYRHMEQDSCLLHRHTSRTTPSETGDTSLDSTGGLGSFCDLVVRSDAHLIVYTALRCDDLTCHKGNRMSVR